MLGAGTVEVEMWAGCVKGNVGSTLMAYALLNVNAWGT